jgi:hypothetical protein
LRALIGELHRLRPRTIIDLGSASDLRMRLWSLFAAPDATIVNTAWPGSTFDEQARATLVEHRSPSHNCILAHRATGFAEIRSDLERCCGRRIDLLFIDGLNPYPLVREAYDALRPLVARGGCLVWDGMAPTAALTDDCDGGDTLWNSVFMLYPYRRLMTAAAPGPRGGLALVRC